VLPITRGFANSSDDPQLAPRNQTATKSDAGATNGGKARPQRSAAWNGGVIDNRRLLADLPRDKDVWIRAIPFVFDTPRHRDNDRYWLDNRCADRTGAAGKRWIPRSATLGTGHEIAESVPSDV